MIFWYKQGLCYTDDFTQGSRILGLRIRYCVHTRTVMYSVALWSHSAGQGSYTVYMYCPLKTNHFRDNILDFCHDIYIVYDTFIRLYNILRNWGPPSDTINTVQTLCTNCINSLTPRPTFLEPWLYYAFVLDVLKVYIFVLWHHLWICFPGSRGEHNGAGHYMDAGEGAINQSNIQFIIKLTQ